MASISRRRFLAGLAAVPVVAACGGDDSGAGPASTGTSTATTAPAPSTTASAPPTTPGPPPPTTQVGTVLAPLTGLPVLAAVAVRPALVVKIDNADGPGGRARPQAGLTLADVVYEEMVEGSVTRLAAVFHTTDADPVGPIRSARDTDVDIVSALQRPLFAWSGGNARVAGVIRSSALVDVGVDVLPGAYQRRRDRRAPHNLYSATPSLFAAAPTGAVPPPALFAFREPGEPAAGRPSTGVHVEYRNPDGVLGALAPVEHRWDPSTGGWVRTQNGTPHVDESTGVVQPANVVVQQVSYAANGDRDSAGNRVFVAELVGEGEVWVFTGGNRVDGRWSKPTREAVTAFVGADGAPILLTPGRTWVLLVPIGGAREL